MENVATYSEARSEYTKQLATFIVPSMVGWFQTLWGRNSNDKQRCLSLFQSECEEVSRWNQDRINDEVRVLLEKSGCDYMEELMTAVFIAHTKVLTAVRLSTKQKKLSITVPKLDHFVHRIFREAARYFWKTPFLFMTDNGVMDRQKNLLQIEALASEAITTAVRGLLPVKQILHDYLDEDVEEDAVAPDVILASELDSPPAKSAAKDVSASDAVPVSTQLVESKEESADVVDLDAKLHVEKAEEKEEEKVTKAPEPVAEKAEKAEKVEEKKAAEAPPPAVVTIDTEPTVHFSSYDDVFDEAKGAPELRYSPKDNDEVDMSDSLSINESSATALSVDDVEDLDAPAPKPAQKAPVPSSIEIEEVEVLE